MIRKGFYFFSKTEKNKGDRDFKTDTFVNLIHQWECKTVAASSSDAKLDRLCAILERPFEEGKLCETNIFCSARIMI